MRTPFDRLLGQRLIEAVKQCPALYDPSHADSKDMAVKSQLWTKITVLLGYESGDEHYIKAKWKNMRDSYLKYKRVKMDNTSKNYRNWPWAPHMEFMDCFYDRVILAPRRTRRAHARARDSDDAIRAKESEDEPEDEPEAQEEEDPEQEDVKPPRALRRRYRPQPRVFPRRPPQRKLDSIDLLFQSYAQTMKTFSAKRRALLKMSISNLFAQAEVEDIEEREGGGDPLLDEMEGAE